jgi:YidC/Oxa1 family membrane protein insertase
MFHLVIKAQQNAAKMTNNMPQFQILQQKMTEARQSGNALEGNYSFSKFYVIFSMSSPNNFFRLVSQLAFRMNREKRL